MIVAKIANTWVLYFNSWYFWNHAGYDNTGFDRIANPVFAGMFQSEKHVYFLYNDAAVDKVQVSTTRIARVCKNDRGVSYRFSSHYKTSIVCAQSGGPKLNVIGEFHCNFKAWIVEWFLGLRSPVLLFLAVISHGKSQFWLFIADWMYYTRLFEKNIYMLLPSVKGIVNFCELLSN